MVFYKPLSLEISSIPIIVYPCKDLEKIMSRLKPDAIKSHLEQLYDSCKDEIAGKGEYHIIILWDDGPDIMTDVWIFSKVDSWGSGPLVDAKIFRNKNKVLDIGVSAGNGLVMLGKEEEHRRTKNSLKEYIEEPRPKLPEFMSINKDFCEKKD